MKAWEKVLRKVKFLGFLMLFAASLGAAAYGFVADVAAAETTPAMETITPAPETTDLVLVKETKDSGEIVFRLVPADEMTDEVTLDDESEENVESDSDNAEEPEENNAPKKKTGKLFISRLDEESEEEPVSALEPQEPYVQEVQPTAFVSDNGYKVIEQYAGNLDYDAILQGPVIYDFGPEGELALEWVVWHESRGEPFDGQVAVAASAINRWEGDCPWFPDKSSIIAVLSQKYQFAYQYVSPENLEKYPDVHRAVQAAIRGADPTVCEAFPDGAQWYYNPAGTSATFPEADYELVIGHHHFHNYGYGWRK